MPYRRELVRQKIKSMVECEGYADAHVKSPLKRGPLVFSAGIVALLLVGYWVLH